MDKPNNNTESSKNKHLNFKERMISEIRIKDGFSVYKIAKELGISVNIIINAINWVTAIQIKKKNYIRDSR